MSDVKTLIPKSLEHLAETVGDPTERIYAHLFQSHPAFADMFFMDTDGGVRASMLETSFMCLLSAANGEDTPRLHLEAAHMHHDAYGLSGRDIHLLFVAIRDVCRAVHAKAWTPALETAWIDVLNTLEEMGVDG